MAGLATAWELSSGDWRERLESITVYQRGWRLGGKGASSRGPHGRIEEHGLHVLLGYYDATFRVLREVYGELDRATTDPGCPDPHVAGGGGAHRGRRPRRGGTDGGLDLLRDPLLGQRRRCPESPGPRTGRSSPVDVATRGIRLLADFLRTVAPPTDRAGSSSAPRRRPARRPPTRAPAARRRPGRAGRAAGGGRARVAAGRGAGCETSPSPRRWPPPCRSSRDDIRAAAVGRPGDATHLATGRPGGLEPPGNGRRRAARRARATSASTTSTSGTGWPATAPRPRRWTRPSCGACTTSTFAYEGGDRAQTSVRGRPRAPARRPHALRLQGIDLLADAGRDGRDRVRPDLPGARPPRRRVPLLPPARPAAARRGPLRRVDRAHAARRIRHRARPLRAAGAGRRPAVLARPAARRPARRPIPATGSNRTGKRREERAPRRCAPAGLRRGRARGVPRHAAARRRRAGGRRPCLAEHGGRGRHRGHPVGAAVARRRRVRPGVGRSARGHALGVRRHVRHLGVDVAPAAPGGVALPRRHRAASPTSAVRCPTPIRPPGRTSSGSARGASSTRR